VRSASEVKPYVMTFRSTRGRIARRFRSSRHTIATPVERDARQEPHERVLDRAEIPIVVEMLAVDVGDDRDRRLHVEERAVRLVRLGDHELALPDLGPRPEGLHTAADHDGRVEPAGREHLGDHRRRRRLPVGARDRDAVLEAS
jgi:hypothetical protein